MKRRDMIIGTAAGSILIGSGIAALLDRHYPDAEEDPEIVQRFFDDLLDDSRDTLGHIERLLYNSDQLKYHPPLKCAPNLLVVDEKDFGAPAMEDNYARNVYTVLKYNPFDFGKGKKTKVQFYPELLKDFNRKEATLILGYNNSQCQDIAEDIKVGKETFKVSQISPNVLNNLLHFRSSYKTTEEIVRLEDSLFGSDINEWFRYGIHKKHMDIYYTFAELMSQNEFSGYEAKVVKSHLNAFGSMVPEHIRYTDKNIFIV